MNLVETSNMAEEVVYSKWAGDEDPEPGVLPDGRTAPPTPPEATPADGTSPALASSLKAP